MLLTHEIGHAIGMGDDEEISVGAFIDDNFDASSSATAPHALGTIQTLPNPMVSREPTLSAFSSALSVDACRRAQSLLV
jgi:hypothetical protein